MGIQELHALPTNDIDDSVNCQVGLSNVGRDDTFLQRRAAEDSLLLGFRKRGVQGQHLQVLGTKKPLDLIHGGKKKKNIPSLLALVDVVDKIQGKMNVIWSFPRKIVDLNGMVRRLKWELIRSSSPP